MDINTQENITIDDRFKDSITQIVEKILYEEFGSGQKSKALSARSRLQFACPYCGDSHSDHKKKRRNLFWNSLYTHCFNEGCPTPHSSLYDFLKDFNMMVLDPSDRIKLLNYIKSVTTNQVKTDTLRYGILQDLYDLHITREDFKRYTKAEEITNGSEGYEILKQRLLITKKDNFLYEPRYKKLYVLHAYDKGSKIIGFQIRNLRHTDAKYLTYHVEKMYEEFKLDIDGKGYNDEQWAKLNHLSMMYGILSVDFKRPFTLFEGPIDSMFYKNSIGQCALGKNVDVFEEFDNKQYFYDNDRDGLKKLNQLAKSGEKVFMWNKFIKDFDLNKYIDEGEKLKDLNDIVKMDFKHRVKMYKSLPNYFTSSKLDLIYV